jgi:hypothetical protein
MLSNKGKVEYVLKLSARDSLGSAGKRGLANREQVTLFRSLPMHTRWENDKPTAARLLLAQSTDRSRVSESGAGCRDVASGGVDVCHWPMCTESSGNASAHD